MGSNDKKSNFVTRQEFEELMAKLRTSEEEKMKIMTDHGKLMKELNKRMNSGESFSDRNWGVK